MKEAAPKILVAIDFGLRNMGVAVGNTVSKTAQPLAILRARDGVPDWNQLTSLIKTWKPDQIIVGHPINMDGSESELSSRAARFAGRLEGRLCLPVCLVDERLSSRTAKLEAKATGHRGDFASNPIDDKAAAIILTTYLNEL